MTRENSTLPMPEPPAIPKPAASELALTIPLTPEIQERLQRHVENSRWSPADVVIELIRTSLHEGYPEIQFKNEVIARGSAYRTIERNPLENFLKINSGQGAFQVSISLENPEFNSWLEHFKAQQTSAPEQAASQACLASLQIYLESLEDFKLENWTKVICPERFAVVLVEMKSS